MPPEDIDADDILLPEVRTGRQRPWRGVAMALLIAAAAVMLVGVWYVLSQPEQTPHHGDTVPRTVLQAAKGNGSASDLEIIYDTEVKAIAPADALAMNAARPNDLLKVPAARPLAVDPANKADPHYEAAVQCLAHAVYYEAASEGDAGERAVAQVVLNRVHSLAFPDTVCGVVYQGAERVTGCQFTFTCDGSLARVPSQAGFERARKIAVQALSGRVDPAVGNATHYHANFVIPYWASSLDKVKTIGAHIFYLMRGPLGAPGAFNQHYDFAYEILPSALVGSGAQLAEQPTDVPTQTPESRLLVAPLAPALAADTNPGRLVHSTPQASPTPSATPSRLRADEQSGQLKSGSGSSRLIVDGQPQPDATTGGDKSKQPH
ncbi:MAG: cell wall hydrolase [Sphingomonadaceae bacterium]